MIISNTGTKIEQIDYKNEAELQAVLFAHPELLAEEGSELVSVKRELDTNAGRIDVVMVNASGIITLVEVKLNRNSEIHRNVLAQIFDYISELSKYSYFQLDQATGKALGNAIDSFENSKELPTIIEDSLRNGLVRLVIAVDESDDNLYRIMDFVAKRTNLRVDLIEVKKYLSNGEYYYSSTPIIQSSSAIKNDSQQRYSVLDKIAEEWAKDPEMLPRINNSNKSYRQIKFDNWPAAVHYEFGISHNKALRIRLDNELSANNPQHDKLSDTLKSFAGKEIMGHTIESRPYSYSTNSGQIIYITLDETEFGKATAIMKELIKLTKSAVDEVLSISL